MHALRAGSAAGSDGIHNEALLHLGSYKPLLKVFNRILSTGHYPKAWRTATIIPLLKPGKTAGVEANYRPISLTSCLAKLFERVVARRLAEAIPLREEQYGFRSSRSTLDVLMWLRTYTEDPKIKTTAVFVDFSRAFDSVDHRFLESLLAPAPLYLRHIIHGFLGRRTAQVRLGVDVQSRRVKMTCGVPQGSVLGPLLFNIAMQDLSNSLGAVAHRFYADDLTLVATGDRRCGELQQALDALHTWATAHFMEVNASKTVFTSFRTRAGTTSLNYGGTPLTEEKTPKLLGVTFNCHRGFQRHCALVRRSTLSRKLVKLRAIGHNVHGGQWQVLRAFHIALVEAPLTYALPVLCGSCAESSWDELNTVQARGAKIVAGLPVTTNTKDALAETHLLPLKTRAELQAYGYLLYCLKRGGARRDVAVKCFPTSSDVGKVLEQVRSQAPAGIESLVPCEQLSSLVKIQPTTLPSLSSTADPQDKKLATEATLYRWRAKGEPPFELWTDGSVKSSQETGGAAILYPPKPLVADSDRENPRCKKRARTEVLPTIIHEKAGDLACSFRAEMVAMAAGLQAALTTIQHPFKRKRRLLVVTDSQSLLMWLRASRSGVECTSLLSCICKTLNELTRFCRVRMQFTYSHCGVTRNEEVDKEADKAASSPRPRHVRPSWITDYYAAGRHIILGQIPASESHRSKVTESAPTPLRRIDTTSIPSHLSQRNSVRFLNALGAQLRCNWSPYFGDLLRLIRPKLPKTCRWCNPQSEPPDDEDSGPATPRPDEEPHRVSIRTTDAVACPECKVVYGSRTTAKNHMCRVHDYTVKEATTLLLRQKPADPPDRSQPPKCPYCDTICSTVARLGKHIQDSHPQARNKTALQQHVDNAPAPDPEPPPVGFVCPAENCGRSFTTKGGLTRHANCAHKIDLSIPKKHRPSDCEESAAHILFECPCLAKIRSTYGGPSFDAASPASWFSLAAPLILLAALDKLPGRGVQHREFISATPPRRKTAVEAGIDSPPALYEGSHRQVQRLHVDRPTEVAVPTSSANSSVMTLPPKAPHLDTPDQEPVTRPTPARKRSRSPSDVD